MTIANADREAQIVAQRQGMGNEIPKPVLTFAVGVAGHRAQFLRGQDIARIRVHVGRVFEAIDKACLAQKVKQPDLFADAAPHIRLFTGLADGTDLIAAAHCPANWEEIAVFPLAEPDYLAYLKGSAPKGAAEKLAKDFASARDAATDRVELLQGHLHDRRPDAIAKGLARSRDFMLHQIDMLVAVWDGGREADPAMAELVARALDADIPVVWIASQKEQAPWLIGDILDVARTTDLADAVLGPIEETVATTLGVVESEASLYSPWNTQRHEVSAQRRLHDFLAERPAERTVFAAYSWFKNLPIFWRGGFLTVDCGSLERTKAEWEPFLQQVPTGGSFSKTLGDILLRRFALVDMLATFYGNRYRSAYVLAYCLSVVAVGLALLGFLAAPKELMAWFHTVQELARLAHDPQPLLELHYPNALGKALLPWKLFLAVVELFCVLAILAIIGAGSWWRWHDRWLDYRALAEMLRHLRFLGLLGEYEMRAYAEAAARPGARWIVWYWRATMREIGAATGTLGPEHQHKLLHAVETAEIDGQIRYHAHNVSGLHRLHLLLHWSGICIFAATIVALVLDLIGLWKSVVWLENRAGWLGFASAFLPALGAALAGIRFTGDFDGFAERSAETGAALEKLKEKYARATDLLDFDETAKTLGETARVMAGDITGWQALYGRKILVLPD